MTDPTTTRPGSRRTRTTRAAAIAAAGLALAGLATACSSSSNASSDDSKPVTLRLGYFPNLTHAPAIVGVEKGIFANALGKNVTLKTASFAAGPAAVEALFSGAIDATYIGPTPATNAYAKSSGAVQVVAGSTSGGASFVVSKSITKPSDLKGKKIATPQLGNTQDIAARHWLLTQGLKTDTRGGGDVHILPQDNSTALTAFAAGQIDGAWVPEPYATRLVGEGGHVLVDERSLWPNGQFVTTNLLVSKKFLQAHPIVVQHLIEGSIKSVAYAKANPTEAQTVVNAYIKKVTSKEIKPAVLAEAWTKLSFTVDPLPATLFQYADYAVQLGLIKPVKDLKNIYDLGPLNQALKAAGQPEVSLP